MEILPVAIKLGALLLIPLTVAFWWTGFKFLGGDSGVFRQLKRSYPRFRDILVGRVFDKPVNRADAPMDDGIVVKEKDGEKVWYLNRRMSAEQYDRLTR